MKETQKITKAFLKHLNKQFENSIQHLIEVAYREGYNAALAQFRKTKEKSK